MKTSLKTTISIIAIAISSVSIAQAGQNRHDRDQERVYEQPRYQHQNLRSEKRHSTRRDVLQPERYGKRSHRNKYNRFEQYREQRHYRKHKRMNRQAKRHAKRQMRAHKRAHRFDRKYKHSGHGYNRIYRQDTYVAPRYIAPRHISSDVFVDNRHSNHNGLPVLAGTIIGSSIANDLSNGDPAATFGGALFGAIIGDALSH